MTTPDDIQLDKALVAQTIEAETQLNRDPFADMRSILGAVRKTIATMAPMLPMFMVNKHLNEANTFKFLEELERNGYVVVPSKATRESR